MLLLKDGAASLPGAARRICLMSVVALLLPALAAVAQSRPHRSEYGRANTFGVFVAYSNDSSHMLLGIAEKRKLLNIGGVYNRRIVMNRVVNWQYSGEIMPVALESDPLGVTKLTQTSPTAGSITDYPGPPVSCSRFYGAYNETIQGTTYSGSVLSYCHGREWTMGEAMSPVGFQWNFLTRRRWQPFLDGHGGYMFSTHPIPLSYAGTFNFTFDFGVGVEFFHTRTRSLRAEYRYHHLSNDNTADANPGVDNGLFQLTYCFGR
jgi:opacity protein-like surface antigen